MNRILKVGGVGNLSLQADLICLYLTVKKTDKDYNHLLKISEEDGECLKDIFVEIGFEKTDLKTISFNIIPEYKRSQDNGKWEQSLIGYQYSHEMKIEFEKNNEILGKILVALSHNSFFVETEVVYTVKDKKEIKRALLDKAVRDAQEKAEILSQAAGVKMKEIQSIDYSEDNINFKSKSISVFERKSWFSEDAEEEYSVNFEPDNINISNTVTIIWEIA